MRAPFLSNEIILLHASKRYRKKTSPPPTPEITVTSQVYIIALTIGLLVARPSIVDRSPPP